MLGLALTALGLAGCTGKGPDPEPGDPCAEVTWEGFAEPVLTTWCTACHSSSIEGEDRRGAPAGLDFDGYERAAAAADLIAGSAGPDTARMPPAGGLTDAQRVGLVQWAECGAPGPIEPTPPPPCAERVVHEGDAGSDVCASGVNAVTGSLTVAEPGADLSCVCEVDGDLVVTGGLGTVELAHLWRVGGALRVEDATLDRLGLAELGEAGSVSFTDARIGDLGLDRLTTVNGAFYALRGALPSTFGPQRLQTVSGTFALAQVDAVVRIDLPRLETVANDFVVDGLPALRQIVHTSDLESLGGSLRLIGNPQLTDVEDLGFLVNVFGDVEIGGGGALRRIDALFDLERIDGEFIVRDEPALDGITGFDQLRIVTGGFRLLRTGALGLDAFESIEQVGEIEIVGNDRLAVWSWQSPASVTGAVRITDNPLLPALSLDQLGSVGGDLVVTGNDSLTDLGAAGLQSVGGAFALEQNGALVSLAGLAGLGTVAGDLTVRGNSALPTSVIDAWLAAVAVGGTVTVEDNAARVSPPLRTPPARTTTARGSRGTP